MHLNKEQAKEWFDAMDRRREFETKFLKDHGWTFDENERYWYGPKGEKIQNIYSDPYDHLTDQLLTENGWKTITEVERHGKLEWNKPLEKWARYQSPKTKRVYSFIEAQYVMEKNWDESDYPKFCCWHTVKVNELLGDNFQEDTFYTWFYLTEYGANPKPALELWQPECNT